LHEAAAVPTYIKLSCHANMLCRMYRDVRISSHPGIGNKLMEASRTVYLYPVIK